MNFQNRLGPVWHICRADLGTILGGRIAQRPLSTRAIQ